MRICLRLTAFIEHPHNEQIPSVCCADYQTQLIISPRSYVRKLILFCFTAVNPPLQMSERGPGKRTELRELKKQSTTVTSADHQSSMPRSSTLQRLTGLSNQEDSCRLRTRDETGPSIASRRRHSEDTASQVSVAIVTDQMNTRLRDTADKAEAGRLTIRINKRSVQDNPENVQDPRARGNRGIRTSGHKVEEALSWASPAASISALPSKSSKETGKKSEKYRNERRKQMKRQLRQLRAASEKVTVFCVALLCLPCIHTDR